MAQGTSDTTDQREKPASYLRMAELLLGSRTTMALRVVVDRRIPDILSNDAKTVAELSSKTDIAAPALERLMRALTNVGVFHEDKHGRFCNSDLSAWLRCGANPSLREMSLVLNDDAPLRAWQQLDRVLATGQPVFAEVNGLTPFVFRGGPHTQPEFRWPHAGHIPPGRSLHRGRISLQSVFQPHRHRRRRRPHPC